MKGGRPPHSLFMDVPLTPLGLSSQQTGNLPYICNIFQSLYHLYRLFPVFKWYWISRVIAAVSEFVNHIFKSQWVIKTARYGIHAFGVCFTIFGLDVHNSGFGSGNVNELRAKLWNNFLSYPPLQKTTGLPVDECANAVCATARCRPKTEADNRVVAEGEDGLASTQFRFDTPPLAVGSFIIEGQR